MVNNTKIIIYTVKLMIKFNTSDTRDTNLASGGDQF